MPNWNEVLKELEKDISTHKKNAEQEATHARSSIDAIRHKYLKKLFKKTNRNIITYYSGWLSKPELAQICGISDEDKNGFMMACHKLDKSKGLDIILHTPGGDIASTESLVDYLRKIFGNNIRAIVPQIAMSAGTMIACSCNSIIMGKHSSLGPIDPQFGAIPAHEVIEEFNRAYEEIKQDPLKIHIWQPIIGKYQPTFLSQCENAIKWSDEFVQSQLVSVMFSGESDAEDKAKNIINSLTDYRGNKTHSRHISIDDCKNMGLKVIAIEDDQDFQELLLTVHHCYMHTLMNTSAFKIIENHLGSAFVKRQEIIALSKSP